MSPTETAVPSPWIARPVVDLALLSFGWVPVLVAYLAIKEGGLSPRLEDGLLFFILGVNFLHRHITFPLVYGDGEMVREHRRAYTWLPALFLVATVGALLYVKPLVVEGKPMEVSRGGGEVTLEVGRGDARRELPATVPRMLEATAAAQVLDDAFRDEVRVSAHDGALRFEVRDAGQRTFIRLKVKSRTAESLGLDGVRNKKHRAKMPLYTALVVLSVLWTIYHTLMQKMGLLRVYSRRGTAGTPVLDRAMVFVWFFAMALWLASKESVRSMAVGRSAAGRFVAPLFEALDPALPFIAGALSLVALGLSVVYLKKELSAAHGFSWPRNLFMASLLALYAVFLWDVVAGYAILGFSHGLEYLAFVYIFSRRKYESREPSSSLMARWMRRPALAMAVFSVVLGAVFVVTRLEVRTYLGWYIVGSSFLHFIYDGWIWKVRRPSVQKPLGLAA